MRFDHKGYKGPLNSLIYSFYYKSDIYPYTLMVRCDDETSATRKSNQIYREITVFIS